MSVPPVPPEILAYYGQGQEEQRLSVGYGPLEAERTRELLLRHLPVSPRDILDVGGGPGAYACWLAARGHAVHLLDASPLHVEQARRASADQPDHPLASVRLGDARHLDVTDTSADAVLLMGPLYHLTDRADRIRALREAWRVLRPGGLLFAVGVSRFASLLDGLFEGLLDGLFEGLLADPTAASIVEEDLRSGQHRNPTPRDYFTTSFFHRPEELEQEVAEGGFEIVETVGIEGPGWVLADVAQRWADLGWREHLLMAARAVEREPSMLGVGAHIMTVGRRHSQPNAVA
jgi:ubiquinone/menaquinone biosynthesis C-methylase UbiE